MIMKKYEWYVHHQEIGENTKSVSIHIIPTDDSGEYNYLTIELSQSDARQFTVGTKVKIEVEVYG